MATRRCSMCNINYPYTLTGTDVCPACSEPLRNDMGLPPHDDWRERVAAVRSNESHGEPRMFPVIKGRLKENVAGQPTISTWDVVSSGISHRLPTDSLIVLRDPDTGEQEWYEVLGYLYKRRRYWVRPFSRKAPDFVPEEWVNGTD